MSKLNIVLCVALFCGLGVNATSPTAPPPPHSPPPGGFHETSEELLNDLFPLFEKALVDYGAAHTDFDLRLKRFVSGKNQVVAGTIYDLIVELENGEKQVVEWSANVVQGIDRKLVEIKLTIPGKEYVIRPSEATRRRRSPQELPRRGGFSKASDQALTDLYPALEKALADWGTAHSDFGLKLKSIESGESQVVAGTIYNLVIKVENADSVVSEWSANVVQNLQGKITEVKLTIPGKEHLLTFE
ncbi:hypothetical protein HA402_003043 [Bradysia odoriphaga]|nr:hypothetical protein HA402_003043 [Bradysia odoriphaga]